MSNLQVFTDHLKSHDKVSTVREHLGGYDIENPHNLNRKRGKGKNRILDKEKVEIKIGGDGS